MRSWILGSTNSDLILSLSKDGQRALLDLGLRRNDGGDVVGPRYYCDVIPAKAGIHDGRGRLGRVTGAKCGLSGLSGRPTALPGSSRS